MRFLLDTNIVSAPMAKRPPSKVVIRLKEHADKCAIPAPVWHELTFGCQRLPKGRKRDALEAYLKNVVYASFPILPYDAAAAAVHGRERARLERLGRSAPFVDGQIAAIAQLAGLTLVTSNTKDFKHFTGLEVLDWATSSRR